MMDGTNETTTFGNSSSDDSSTGGAGGIVPVEYDPPLEAMTMASMPRFGHGRDMSVLFSGNTDAAADYVVGLIFVGAFILAVFVAWSIFLLVFMCCRHKRVGWLSGRPFVVRKPAAAPTEEDDDNDDRCLQTKGTGLSEPETNSSQGIGGGGKSDDENENEFQQETGGELQVMGGSATTDQAAAAAAAAAPGWSEYASEEAKASLRQSLEEAERTATATAPSGTASSGGGTSVQSYPDDCKYKYSDDYSKDCCCGCCGVATLVRILFLLCGAAFLVSVILMVTEGVTNLEKTVQTVGHSAGHVADLAASFEDIYASTFSPNRTDQAMQDRNVVEEELGDTASFCPANPDLSAFDPDLSNLLSDVDVKLDQLGNMLQAETSSLNTTVVAVRVAAEQVSEVLTTANVPDWVAPVIIAPCAVIVGSLMVAASLGLCGIPIPCVVLCVLNWIVVPVFILLVAVSVVVAASISIASGINCDFCLPGGTVTASPDTSIKNIMIASGVDNTSDTYQLALYYVDQCQYLDNPLLPVQEFIPAAEQAADFLQQVNDTLGNATFVAELVTECARQYDVIDAAVRALTGILSTVIEAVVAIIELLKCEVISTLYTNTVYNAMCRYSVTGVYWIFATTLAMGALGMVMLTTRSACKSDYVQFVPVIPSSTAAATTEKNHNDEVSSAFQDEESKAAADALRV